MTEKTFSTAQLETIGATLSSIINNNQITIPMLPEVAGKVLRLTQDPDSDASQLAALVQSDQSLAAHVMRIANSAAYSPNASIVSIQQAIARLGMQTISEIAMAASINSDMFDAPGFEKHINYALRYSLATGLWSKEVARACRKNVEAAFLSGLLHDIGRPIAVQEIVKIANKKGISLTIENVLELENLFQAELGSKVLEQWEMPATVREVVMHFDDYQTAHSNQVLTMTVVAGAKFVDHFMCESEHQVCLTLAELVTQDVLAELNLYTDDVEKILSKDEVIKSAMEVMSA